MLTPIPFQGTWGSVGWSIDDSGTLTLEGGVGADTNRQSPWWLHESSVNSIVINGNIEAPIDSSYLFYNFANLTMIENLSRLDFSKVKDMRGMFENNSSLTEIELAEEMRAVETMEGTFAGASALKHLNLADWDVSDGIDINHFLSETALDVVDLSGWDSKRVTADGAFEGMPSLEYLDISGISIPEEKASSIMRMANKLKTLVIGEDTYLREFWVPEGKIWEGQNTGHKFGLFYNSGYADTYRLTEGKLGYRVLDLVDSTGPEARYWDGGYFYGEVGEKVDLAKVELPIDYELQDPQQNISLLPFDEENWEDVYAGIELKQIPKTTTRRITFTGLPEGLLEDVTQEVKWHWEWRNEWGGGMRDSKALARVDDGWTQVYSPLNHYEAYTVPTVPGYQASVTIVAAEHVDSDEDITELNNAETVTVHYTKLSTGGGGNSADGSNTGSGSSTGTGNVANADNSTMDTSSADESLPQTGSVFASGLAALGLGLLGLLGINWRKRRRS